MSTRTGELAPQPRSQPGRVPVGGPAAPARAEQRNLTPAGAGRSVTKASGNGDRGLLEALLSSKVFLDYERAFTAATGLPVALRPVESWQLPHPRQTERGTVLRLDGGEEPFLRLLPGSAGEAHPGGNKWIPPPASARPA